MIRLSPRERRWEYRLFVAAIVVTAVVLVVIQRPTVSRGLKGFRHLHWSWVAGSSACELASILAMAMLYRLVLVVNGARLPARLLIAMAHTTGAVSIFVPLIGPGLAGRYAYLRLRDAGATPAVASLTLTLVNVISLVAFATIPLTIAVVSGSVGAALSASATSIALIALALGAGLLAHAPDGPARLAKVLRGVQRVIRRPRRDALVVAAAVTDAIRGLRFTRRSFGATTASALAYWWADAACLALAIRAAGIDNISVFDTLLVWTAGAATASISPTPGGIGAVEVAMAAAFSGLGNHTSAAITAILLYRVISWKLTGTTIAYLYERRVRRKRPQAHQPCDSGQASPGAGNTA